MAPLALIWLATLAAAAPAAAQPASDPIGALLDHPGQMTPETDEPDTAGQPVQQEPEPPVRAVPLAPRPYVPPSGPQLTEPTHLEETGKSPDGPPTVNDLAYESRIRSSVASAQSFQGPLDGGWTLSAGGADLYALQLVDRGNGVQEGAWRDLRRLGALGASGFIDQIESQGPDLTLRFTLASGAAAQATLHADARGWSGDLTEGGERQAVQMRRKTP